MPSNAAVAPIIHLRDRSKSEPTSAALEHHSTQARGEAIWFSPSNFAALPRAEQTPSSMSKGFDSQSPTHSVPTPTKTDMFYSADESLNRLERGSAGDQSPQAAAALPTEYTRTPGTAQSPSTHGARQGQNSLSDPDHGTHTPDGPVNRAP